MRCRRRDIEVAEIGALEARCRRVDVEMQRCGALAYCLLLLEFLAFVPRLLGQNACRSRRGVKYALRGYHLVNPTRLSAWTPYFHCVSIGGYPH